MKMSRALAIAGLLGAGAAGAAPAFNNEGAGIYSDASVANQVSSFTINPRMVSCGVGTVTADTLSGPFAMLMYATQVLTYSVSGHTITATGTMRSITQIAGLTVEDVEHQFTAIAVDNNSQGLGPDRFDVHFHTPFWNPSNPLCTPSTVIPGDCRFGGSLLIGDVAASQ